VWHDWYVGKKEWHNSFIHCSDMTYSFEYAADMNESCHTYEWVMSHWYVMTHMWMSHGTHINQLPLWRILEPMYIQTPHTPCTYFHTLHTPCTHSHTLHPCIYSHTLHSGTQTPQYILEPMYIQPKPQFESVQWDMGWLRLVGSLKS